MLVITCPHCYAAVVPQTDGSCPACGRAIPLQQAQPFVIQSRSAAAGDQPEPSAPLDPYGRPLTRGEPPQQAIAKFRQRLFEITPHTLVTPAIVAVNAVVFVLMVIDSGAIFAPDGKTLIDWGANFGPLTLDGQWRRLLTCTFVHIGLIHIGLNMWVLWDVGQLVERLTGNVGFLLLYLLSGLFGSLASVYWNSNVLSAGASGAVFGAFGGLMGFVLLRGDSIPKSILGRLRASGSSFLFYNLIFGLAIPGIDMAAHAGGFVSGFVCGLVLSQPLDRVTLLTRTWRNMVMAVLGTASLAAALSQAPVAPVDFPSRALAFSTVEKQALDTYNEAVGEYRNGRLSEDEFARTIETQVLPPWRAARQEFDQIDVQRVAADSRESLAKLKRYLLLREQAWEALAAGLKGNDPQRLEEANEKSEAAGQLGRQVGAGN